jgi:hypothetical protein
MVVVQGKAHEVVTKVSQASHYLDTGCSSSIDRHTSWEFMLDIQTGYIHRASGEVI